MNRTSTWEGSIPAAKPLPFLIKHSLTDRRSHVQEIDMHTHREFELYINLKGDISFLAEDRLYPLTRGDVFLARPGEHHHCVYHSDVVHEFFWILFDCENNRALFEFLFEDPSRNFISPSAEQKNELIELCFSLTRENLSDSDRFFCFFRLLHILKTGLHHPLQPKTAIPEDLARMLSYVELHLAEPLSLATMAKDLYVSQSTIERRFRETVGLTPLDYVRNRKLHTAATLLRSGNSVSQAGMAVGYADTSYFIRLFRKRYGVTPHQYKKSV